MSKKIAISGSRDIINEGLVRDLLKPHLTGDVVMLVGDCPRGVDRIATELATELGIHCTVFEADWEAHGRAAGPLRNRKMVADADQLVAIKRTGSANKGTSSAIAEAERASVEVVTYEVAEKAKVF